jgi:fucose 4-O-acetylase-like acetyltransferase
MTRNASFDYARLAAVFGVVLFHARAPGAAWGYAGLPYFLLLMGLFVVPTAERVGTADFVRSRARRLLVPWLTWSAIYGTLLVADALANGRPPLDGFAWWMLLTGPAIHLWFLPFAFVIGTLLHSVARIRGGDGAKTLVPLGWAGAGMAFAALGLAHLRHLPPPFGQWLFALPGLGLGLLLFVQGGASRIFGVAAVVSGAWALGWTDNLFPLVLGLTALMLCMAVQLPEKPRSRALADLAMVVYLAHPLIQFLLNWVTTVHTDTLWSGPIS